MWWSAGSGFPGSGSVASGRLSVTVIPSCTEIGGRGHAFGVR